MLSFAPRRVASSKRCDRNDRACPLTALWSSRQLHEAIGIKPPITEITQDRIPLTLQFPQNSLTQGATNNSFSPKFIHNAVRCTHERFCLNPSSIELAATKW